jgi:hypothetical protein
VIVYCEVETEGATRRRLTKKGFSTKRKKTVANATDAAMHAGMVIKIVWFIDVNPRENNLGANMQQIGK